VAVAFNLHGSLFGDFQLDIGNLTQLFCCIADEAKVAIFNPGTEKSVRSDNLKRSSILFLTFEWINPTTQFDVWHLLDFSSFACEKGTPDDFAVESIEQAKSPFQYQTFSSARLPAGAV
jgi:hypothetical protein